MILDATTKKLQVVLGGAITTNQLHINATWADTASGATFGPGATSALTNGATPVDIVAAPAAATQRQVKEVTVQNTDTVAAVVTVQTVDGANTRKNIVVTLQSGETLFFAAGQWGVLATNGALKNSSGVSSVALTVPARQTVTGSPITTTGTLAVTDNSQSANTFFAGPAGASGTPVFRTLAAADLNSLAFTTGSVPFGNASGGLSQDNAKLFWNDPSGFLGVNTAAPDAVITANANTGASLAAPTPGIHIMGADAVSSGLTIDSYGGSPNITIRKTGGTRAAPSVIDTTLVMGSTVAAGWNGAAYYTTGLFRYEPTETWSGTVGGANLIFQTTMSGGIARTTKFTVFNDGRFAFIGARGDQSYSYQTPLTGVTIVVPNVAETLICEPAAAIAALTVTMAAAPIDGQLFQFTCTQNITALVIQANTGQTMKGPVATVYVANATFGWTYRLANTTWYRTHA